VLYPWYLIIKNYQALTESKQNQIKYVFVASLIGFIGGATNYPLWYNIPVLPVGTLLVGLHVLILAYAIAKYRLMNISVTITRAGIFLAVYALVLGLPFLFAINGKTLLIEKLGTYWWLGPLVLMASLGATGPFVYLFLKNKAEGMILREQRAYQTALKNAAVDLTRIRNPQKIFDFIAQTITESVKISFSAIYFLDPKTNKFILKSLVPARNGHPESIDNDDPLVPALIAKRESIVLEESRQEADMDKNKATSAIIERMEKLYAAVIVPCFLENRLINIMVLGEKLSGKSYTQEDIDNFSILAAEISLATENALLYEKIENEVRVKTEELITVQKELVHAEKLATVGTLAGGVAHEINNPLTAILTNVQMLLSDNELDRESLEMIEEATKRCKTIVQKLMTFSQKPLASTMMYEVNVLDITRHTVNFLKFQLEQENITLEIKAEKKSYPVLANHDELEQVLTNIVLNAKDATKQVKKSGTVYISISEDETHIMVSVKDEGVGIPKEILNRIFDPFYTTKEVGKGLGLGLSICQTIIEKHNGKILVESQVNIGSTFIIKIPKFRPQTEKIKASK
jgi:two-component system nitrogen regulation sensor histidine kinase GlnL